MTKLIYNFKWNDTEAKKFSAYYEKEWADRAKKCIHNQLITDIPATYDTAALHINPQAGVGKSFAKFIESEIPNPWDFNKSYKYAYSTNNQNWFQLLPLTPWIWLSQIQPNGTWLIWYGLNRELIQLMNDNNIPHNDLKVIRWPN